MVAIEDNIQMRPITLGQVVCHDPADVARVIIEASDAQVNAKGLVDPEVRADFLTSCDGLNTVRGEWRLSEELGLRPLPMSIAGAIRAAVCSARGYDPDDFDSAIQATRKRARVPFGWTAVDYAMRRSKESPIRLLQPGLAGAKVPTAIANIALQLFSIQEGKPILLPIDQLRGFLQQRKIVVSGAVQRLVEAGVLGFEDRNYHTGKAREFRFTGVAGEHFEYETTPPALK